MGDVYRAHDSRLGRDIALKVLPPDVASDAERLARFRREARAVAALNHPNIVTIHSIEEEDGTQFITMELVEGRSLDQVLSGGALSLTRFFDVGVALADALAAAHRKQIVHRDVKPANVMVSDEGAIKILDFGLARAAEPAVTDHEMTSLGLTQAGIIVGTVPYMSPEQIEARPVDHRSDIFSLGIVLYEMATGTRPFSGGSAPALMSSILKDQPRPVTELRPEITDGVWRLVARCLEKSSAERVQSAQEVLVELKALGRAWESGETTRAPRAAAAATAVPTDLRVAVLPFACRGGADAEALADGLTDDITAGLSRFQHLRVASRFDAEKAKGSAADARAAATVGARYLIDGTVRMAGEIARLSVRLLDTSVHSHMWAETYERSTAGHNLFAIQDDITAHVVAVVADKSGVLARSMGTALKARPVDALDVNELVLRFYAYEAQLHPEEHGLLRDAFERRLAGDEVSANAWACLAMLYDQEHSVGFNPRPDTARRQRGAAEKAIEIDGACSDGWRAMGAAAFFFDRDLTALRLAADRVATLNRLDVHALADVGRLLAYAGDWQRGLELVRLGMALNPHHQGWYHFPTLFFHYARHEYEPALSAAKRINMPAYFGAHVNTMVAAAQLGRRDEVEACLRSLERTGREYLDVAVTRRYWKTWLWDTALVDHLVEGFVKAKALAEPPAASASGMRSGYLGGAMFSGVGGRPASGAHASIAVMPFADLSAAKDQEWFCDGIAEEILNALTPLKNLRVAARASAFSLRGKSDDLKTIGEKLNVTTVLGGSVRRAGDRVRITVQLSEVQSGSQLWSDRYDRELKDIFDVQDEIAKAVADRLKVTLADTPLDRLARLVEQGTTNVDAYQLYLQGRALLSRRGSSILPALELFQRAVELDPSYSLAWAGIADAYTVMAYFGAVPPSQSKPQALVAARRALELDPSSAAGHTALACATLLYENNRSLAGQEFECALQLNPRYVQGRCWYALFYVQWALGDFERGIAEARRALEDDPLSAYVTQIVAACLGTAGRLDEAIGLGRKAVELDPESFVARWVLGTFLSEAGRYEEAASTFQYAADMSERHAYALVGMAVACGRRGRREAALSVLRELTERAQRTYVSAAHLLLAAEAAGDRDLAIQYAERAWADREPPFTLFARHFPDYRTLHSDRRFTAILDEMNADNSPAR
jgi:TolB-like protein/Tfp pilus assembly protein PilF